MVIMRVLTDLRVDILTFASRKDARIGIATRASWTGWLRMGI